MSEPIIYVNGEFVPQSQARISVMDHAVLYGDGMFDTVAAWNGRIFKLDAHIERFFRSMAAVGIAPPIDRAELARLLIEAVRRNELQDAYIKWICTRGSNGKPLMDPSGCVPNLIVIARPYIQRRIGDGGGMAMRMKTAAIRRPPGQVLDPHIKSLNYLNLVLAKLEAKAAQVDECLLLDINGRICEAPGFNVFLVQGKSLRTPSHDILEGITRATVMELAKMAGFSCREEDLELYDAYTADEIFLTSTAGGLVPVGELDGRRIGDGKPGPVFSQLSEAYLELARSGRYGTPVYE
ncbi:MAG: branched-chain amino acid aminotransferase [Rhodomicrobium sp.]|nr:branched-chain amino acid aminotransferase [Rhodomicrobium sp.]